jgi:hypothetical protein
MEDIGNMFDHINKFNELIPRLMNVWKWNNIKYEDQALLLLTSLPNLINQNNGL